MYFSKPDFHVSTEITARAIARAEQAKQLVATEWNLTLDGTEEDLAKIDAILRQVRSQQHDGNRQSFLAEILSSYVGEIVRRELGGVWGQLRFFTDLVPAIRVGRNEITWCISTHVLNLLDRSTLPTLVHHYQGLRKALNAEPQAGLLSNQYRHYKVRHDNGYFYAGSIRGNRTILSAVFYSGLTILFFDETGKYLGNEVRPLPRELPRHPKSGSKWMPREAEEEFKKALEAWMDDLGFSPCPITIEMFHAEDLGIGIEDYPSHLEGFLEAPDTHSKEEQEEMKASIAKWEEDGSFVLYWGNDLWLNGDGEVTSS